MTRVPGFTTYDVRLPTSLTLDGSDAMNKDPDYLTAFLHFNTDDSSWWEIRADDRRNADYIR